MELAFKGADILLPGKGVDLSKWAVIACDQFTSEPEYWEETERIVGEEVSALNLVLPEVYLDKEDAGMRIETIRKNMEEYLKSGLFEEYKDAMIYVRRTDSSGKVREGLIGCIDLEYYDYAKYSKSAIRATEMTVLERIPPRVEIRKDASLELPHIMVLVDDEKKTVIEPLGFSKDRMRKLYDTELMQEGGSIEGYLLTEEQQKQVKEALCELCDVKLFQEKYHTKEEDILLFAMGDGNHSLATAKACYESMTMRNPEKDFSKHPARYALVELVNLHSPALEFEAIHRLLTEADTEELVAEMKKVLGRKESGEGQKFLLVLDGKEEEWIIEQETSNLTLGSLQNFLDQYMVTHEGKLDYIHGTDTVRKLAGQPGSIGMILPDMGKEELFPTVIADGELPRKTFSMGHARDKRYYMEARRIKER